MILSRAKPASGEGARKSVSRKEIPTLEQFLAQRDYTGALTLLEFNNVPSSNKDSQIWIAYCAFHLGNYKKAADIYTNLKNDQDAPTDIDTYIACCFFYLGMYLESEKMLANAPDSQLKTRLLLHLSCKLSKTNKIKEYEDKLQNNVEDQLCLASVHYLQTHYQEAIDIYKKVLLKNRLDGKHHRKKQKSHEDAELAFYKELLKPRDYLALNVYVALCYYKLDYYDVAQKVLQVYLQKYPDSATAINLKACNIFHYYKSTSEMAEIKQLIDKASNDNHFNNDLIQHNTVVFRNGEGALQILPGLVDVIPEARLNLVIYYLKQNEIQEAHELIKELEPSVAQEYILKGIVNAILGQERNSREYIKSAQQFFQLVGTSASECDTIPGRQCMASFYFLYRQFKDVLIYLNSIRSYFSNVDGFNFNYAQAQAAVGHFKEAEEAFLAIRNDRYRNDFTYINILAYCHIMNKKGQLAWELYLKMEPSSESFGLLQLIANSCYVVGEFWYAAKAFDMLERLDPSPEHWEGKRGACCGTFQCIVMEKLPKELLSEVIKILKNTNNTQAEQIIRVMRKWGKENRVSF